MHRHKFFVCVGWLFILFLATIELVPSNLTAEAMSDSWYPPTCELNFKDSDSAFLSSKSTQITYNDGSAQLTTTYKFSASAPTTLSCSLPVFCSQVDVANYGASLYLNGSAITPSYGYSFKSVFLGCESYSEILALRESYSDFDATLPVHSFSISATEETVFSFSLQPTVRLIYEFGRYSYHSANRLYEVKVSPNMPCHFTVFGNKPTVNTSELCSITYSEQTVSDYISEYAEFLSVMANGIDCTEIITHCVMNFLSSASMVKEGDLLDECMMHTYAFLDYSLSLPIGDSTIVVNQPMAVGLNSLYSPNVYVGKIFSPAQSAPLLFSVNTEQYVVDSTLALNNNSYSGDAVEAVTIAFCSVKAPDLVNPPTTRWEPWRIAVVSVSGVIGVMGIVGLLVLSVQAIKARKNK